MNSTRPSHFNRLLPPPVGGLAWILICGVVDWMTGPELALSAFYLPGVALVAWFSGRKPALAMAFCAALVWLFAELAAHQIYSKSFVPYWNGTIRFSIFGVTAFLTSEVRARQQTEAALREQDSILRSILDSMGDGVVVIGGNGRVLAFNPAAEKLLGGNPLGGDALQWVKEVESHLLDGVTTETEKSNPLRLAVAGRLSGNHEISLHRADEEETKLLDLTALPLVARQGKAAGVVMVIADQTARRTLEKRIAEASEREQRRIGQDLHDGVCQHLVGVAFAAGSLQSTLESRALDADAAAAGEIASLINEAISEARNLAHGLYPAGLEEGIEIALRTLASTTQERTGIVCTARIANGNAVVDSVSSVHLYRIAQECVSNACRHGEAETITISLEHQSGHLQLVVADDGKGMDTSSTANCGIGLNLMRHRASLMGGTLEIESHAGQGARIICNLPATGTIASAA
jgi:signal transduction histidine kinase